jgi:3-oxoacyl-[acyl-carrier protein] reductase
MSSLPTPLVTCDLSLDFSNLLLTITFSIAFGHILTRLTQAKEEGAFAMSADGEKIALGIPSAQKANQGAAAHADIPLRRPGTATEAASVILALASPLFSYVSGQCIMVTGGRNM